MTKRSSSWIVCAQKAMLRAVSVALTPTRDLNHCRVSSSSVMSAIGVPQILRRQQRQIVERLLGLAVQDPVASKRREAPSFIVDHRCLLRFARMSEPGFGAPSTLLALSDPRIQLRDVTRIGSRPYKYRCNCASSADVLAPNAWSW